MKSKYKNYFKSVFSKIISRKIREKINYFIENDAVYDMRAATMIQKEGKSLTIYIYTIYIYYMSLQYRNKSQSQLTSQPHAGPAASCCGIIGTHSILSIRVLQASSELLKNRKKFTRNLNVF
jgi:hypothetical protein